MVNRWTSLFVGMLALSATAAMAAEAPRAMLYATGNVSVNGSSVTRSTTVFDGDTIQTKSDSAVTLTNNGSSVVVPGNSSVVYTSGAVNLASGSAAIKTTRGMSAHVGSMTISPSSGAARYRVQQNGNKVEIASLEGTVAVTGGSKNVSVDAGQTVTMAMNQDPTPPPATTTTTTTTTSGNGTAAGSSTGASVGSSSAGLIAGLGAVLAAAIASAVAVTTSKASASTP